jgi:DNA-binding NarL/FixJ family response regulator
MRARASEQRGEIALAQPIRVVVAEDHPVYRAGLVMMVNARPGNIEIVGEAADGAAALRLVAETSPDVVLMDIRMAGMDGIEATRQIKQRFPGVKVLALSAYDGDDCVLEMLKAGASGYMLKDADHAVILSGIADVHEGNGRIHPRLAPRVFEAFAELSNSGSQRGRSLYDGLTERELEVLRLLATGASNRQIAERLWISERTVDNHVLRIYRKIDVSDRAQAILYSIRKGLVPTVADSAGVGNAV